jgi:hypothetical protein
MVGRSTYFDKLLDDRLHLAAPHAEFGSTVMTAAEAGARLAVQLLPAAAEEGK